MDVDKSKKDRKKEKRSPKEAVPTETQQQAQQGQQQQLSSSGQQNRKTSPDVTSLPSWKTLQAMKPKMPPDYQIIMSPPFSDCTQIDETVFLTGIGGMTKENIRDLGITLIVNATFEAPNLRQEGLESLRICVDDVPTDDISQYFELAADKMNEHTTRGGKIIVHCVAGVSRSAALILAYLIKYKKMTLHDAFNMVREKRNVVRPNNGFFRQLIEFEKKYLGKASVKMINVEKEGTVIEVPDFFETEHPRMILVEAIKAKSKQIHQQAGGQPC